MESRLLGMLGTIGKHILTGIRRALYAVALTFIIVALVVAAATEVIGSILTKQIPPSGPTHLAAAALAISFGYAAAITVALGEILRAIIDSVELIIREAEALEKKAAEELSVLARKGEEEALRLGRATVTDAGAVGRTVLSDAGRIGGAVTGVVGGAVGGVEREVRNVEHGVGAHLPGHHAGSQGGTTSNTSTTQQS